MSSAISIVFAFNFSNSGFTFLQKSDTTFSVATHNVECSMSDAIIDLNTDPDPFAFKHSISWELENTGIHILLPLIVKHNMIDS